MLFQTCAPTRLGPRQGQGQKRHRQHNQGRTQHLARHRYRGGHARDQRRLAQPIEQPPSLSKGNRIGQHHHRRRQQQPEQAWIGYAHLRKPPQAGQAQGNFKQQDGEGRPEKARVELGVEHAAIADARLF